MTQLISLIITLFLKLNKRLRSRPSDKLFTRQTKLSELSSRKVRRLAHLSSSRWDWMVQHEKMCFKIAFRYDSVDWFEASLKLDVWPNRQNKAWFVSWKVRPLAKALVDPKVTRKCLISYSFPISQKMVVFTRAFCVSTSLFSVALSKASLITSSSSTVVVPLSARTFVFVLSFDVIFSIIY